MDTSEKTECSEKEMNVVPYDPPYEVFARKRFTSTGRCLQFDFQSLVGISETIEKYSIDSIKSLCEFSPASAEEADREMIEELQIRYPGLILAGNIKGGIGMADRIRQATGIAKELAS